MIYIVTKQDLRNSKTLRPDYTVMSSKIAKVEYLPRIGEVIRFPNYMGIDPIYYIVTGVLHNYIDTDDIDIYLTVKPYEYPQP